ncbi:MAG: hypothetical protein AB2765_07845 [Candidatus Thiodiazotropha endolucinida]
MNHDPTINDKTPKSPDALESAAIAPLHLDPDQYRDSLDQFELSEEQQNELLGVLWHIMRTFVEIGFGLDSVQNIFYVNLENALREDSGALQEKDHFNQLAGANGEHNTERSHK